MDDEGGKKFLLMLFFVYWIPMRDVVMDLESFPCEKVVCVLSLQKNSEGMKFSLSNKVT